MKKKIIALAVFSALAILTFAGISNDYLFSPVSTNAQQSVPRSFDDINEDIKINNANPTYEGTHKIAGDLMTNLSALELTSYIQDSVANDVALAHMNGASTINNSNVVSAVNNLATQSSAPSYAHTNEEQVKVVRTFLHSLVPDLVKTQGSMDDLQAFVVFTATVGQKIDNEAFMVTPAVFTASMNQTVSQPFPGSPESEMTNIEVIETTPQMVEMLNVVNGFVNSKQMMSCNNILNSIGIN